jgi:hypothetical protein
MTFTLQITITLHLPEFSQAADIRHFQGRNKLVNQQEANSVTTK